MIDSEEVQYVHIYGCEYYKIGSDGSLWTCRTRKSGNKVGANWGVSTEWKPARTTVADSGHLKFPMTIGDKAIRPYVHTLVLEHFKCRRPEGMICRHLDGNPKNNCISNLEWGTYQENADDAIRHGATPRGSKKWNAQLNEETVVMARRRVRNGETTADIAREMGIKYGRLFDAVYGRSWKYITEPPVSCPQEKLTDKQVLEIRRLSASGVSGKELSSMFNVSASCISSIVNNRKRTKVS